MENEEDAGWLLEVVCVHAGVGLGVRQAIEDPAAAPLGARDVGKEVLVHVVHSFGGHADRPLDLPRLHATRR